MRTIYTTDESGQRKQFAMGPRPTFSKVAPAATPVRTTPVLTYAPDRRPAVTARHYNGHSLSGGHRGRTRQGLRQYTLRAA